MTNSFLGNVSSSSRLAGISRAEFQSHYPTTLKEMARAVDQVSQDLLAGELTRYSGVSLRMSAGHAIVVTKNDKYPMRFPPPSDTAIPHTFRFVMGYVRDLLNPGSQAQFDTILTRRFRSSVPAVTDLAQGIASPAPAGAS